MVKDLEQILHTCFLRGSLALAVDGDVADLVEGECCGDEADEDVGRYCCTCCTCCAC